MDLCIYSRKPQWSDTDAARVIFTGRIADYLIEAIDHFMGKVAGHRWFEMNMDVGVGTPFVSVAFDVFKPITPRMVLKCPVFVEKVGNSSVTFRIEIYDEQDTLLVTGKTVNVFVDSEALTKTSIPREIRERLESYQRQHGAMICDN